MKNKLSDKKVFVIAEAGVNHNGDIRTAKKMIDAAVKAGADAVKFQTFVPEDLVSKKAPKADYQKSTTDAGESQLEMLKKLSLNADVHKELIEHCRKRKIQFLSTPFDMDSVNLLSSLGLDIFKVPSGEITNLPYLKKIGSLKKKIIMSTGMSDMKEIGRAMKILVEAGASKEDITLLHCNTEYPTPFEDVNLLAMVSIRKKFGVKVGYSDHTPGIEAPIAAVALGAVVIEKHFTLDKNAEGPDHRASLEPKELEAMVTAIRNTEKAIGNGIKKPSPSEMKNIVIARKSIVASRAIRKGDVFTTDNITAKRPGTGISPMKWHKVVGKKAKKNFSIDEIIEI